MPNTRSSNRSVNFKAYYSKKAAPNQQHFPHHRKIVRRPDPRDDGGKKQTELPEILRRRGTVQDSDDESCSVEEEEEVLNVLDLQSKKKGKKRSSDVMRNAGTDGEDDEPVRPTPKRRRKPAARVATPKPTAHRRRIALIAPAADDNNIELNNEMEKEDIPKPSLRRQATMTQIVDGRSPVPGSDEPEFRPVKRTPRTSWGGKGNRKDAKKDLKQRTLTQMVHTMTPLILDSNEETEEEKSDEEADAAHHSFIFGDDEEVAVIPITAENKNQENSPPEIESVTIENESDEGEDEYRPTQFIEEPVRKTRRAPRRASSRLQLTATTTKALESSTKKSPQTRLKHLSTPEKCGVLEIPSSQSPPETPVSTQNTPKHSGRSPLKLRSANASKSAKKLAARGVESPSKRKQVTFLEVQQEHIPPPTLKKFASTIPDSEGDDSEFSDDGAPYDTEYGVGAETQAILLQTDQACNNADKDASWAKRTDFEELGGPSYRDDEVSQELGAQHPPHATIPSIKKEQSSDTPELPSLPFSSPKPQNISVKAEPSALATISITYPIVQQMPSSPPIEDFRTQPPNPMFADDESPEEVEDPASAAVQQSSTPTKRPRSSPPIEDFRTQLTIPMFDDDEPSEDLDEVAMDVATGTTLDDPVEVPRSPPSHLQPEPSHSSQAERQLQFEHKSYSQHPRRDPPFSSMNVAQGSTSSYQETPHPFPRQPTQPQPSSHLSRISQATTMDPTQMSPKVTPRKKKAKEAIFTRSATRTPKSRKENRGDGNVMTTPSTQRQNGSALNTPKSAKRDVLMSSPEASRPAPLFIPSSFPSPARVTMEGWSSPVVGKESQWGAGSLEDFSIPAPPPGSAQWMEDEEF